MSTLSFHYQNGCQLSELNRNCFRQSETTEQQDYEANTLMGHSSESYHPIDDDSEKFKDETHPSMKSKMKGVWK